MLKSRYVVGGDMDNKKLNLYNLIQQLKQRTTLSISLGFHSSMITNPIIGSPNNNHGY